MIVEARGTFEALLTVLSFQDAALQQPEARRLLARDLVQRTAALGYRIPERHFAYEAARFSEPLTAEGSPLGVSSGQRLARLFFHYGYDARDKYAGTYGKRPPFTDGEPLPPSDPPIVAAARAAVGAAAFDAVRSAWSQAIDDRFAGVEPELPAP